MGFAVTRFRALSKLCRYTPQHMLRYNLSALVLNDPSSSKFIRHMGEHMDELNSRTGENFLFFSLVEPPEKWGGAINPCYSELQLPRSEDNKDRVMLYNFLSQVELDDVPLPGILLTTGPLQGNSCIYIPTNTNVINDQLIALGDFCSHRGSHSWIELSDPDLQCLIDKISIEDPVWSVGLPQSIAESLRLVSSVRDMGTINEHEAIMCIRKHLRFLTDKSDLKYLTTVANYFEVLSSKRVTRSSDFYSRIEGPFFGFMSNRQPSYNELVPIELNRRLHEETKISLYTYNVFLKIYQQNRHDIDDALGIELDPSVLNSSLLKGVENELNLSVVQAMRERLGIPMPEYYAKYCPDGDAVIVRSQNRHRIDLNREKTNRNRRGNLESVSIGDVRGAYIDMVRDGQIDCFEDNNEFCNILYHFSRQRNNHAGVDYQYLLDSAMECNKLMSETFMPRYMDPMIDLKEDLSDNRHR